MIKQVGKKIITNFTLKTFAFLDMSFQFLMPLFHTDNESPESPRINKFRIRLNSWRIVNFSTHSIMFYNSVTKHGRNSYEYLQDLAGFGLNRLDTVTNSL